MRKPVLWDYARLELDCSVTEASLSLEVWIYQSLIFFYKPSIVLRTA